jgi:hypothetical protein
MSHLSSTLALRHRQRDARLLEAAIDSRLKDRLPLGPNRHRRRRTYSSHYRQLRAQVGAPRRPGRARRLLSANALFWSLRFPPSEERIRTQAYFPASANAALNRSTRSRVMAGLLACICSAIAMADSVVNSCARVHFPSSSSVQTVRTVMTRHARRRAMSLVTRVGRPCPRTIDAVPAQLHVRAAPANTRSRLDPGYPDPWFGAALPHPRYASARKSCPWFLRIQRGLHERARNSQ